MSVIDKCVHLLEEGDPIFVKTWKQGIGDEKFYILYRSSDIVISHNNAVLLPSYWGQLKKKCSKSTNIKKSSTRTY